ncbi:hypothetical protein ABIA38_006509 [Embleya sp. AB8]
MEPADADVYFGKVLRGSPSGTRPARPQALTTYFMFLELRHKVARHCCPAGRTREVRVLLQAASGPCSAAAS